MSGKAEDLESIPTTIITTITLKNTAQLFARAW